MTTFAEMDVILKHVYSEPKAAAFIEWVAEHSAGSQLEWQLGRPAMEQYAST